MKINISKDALNGGLKAVSPVAKGRQTLPILNCILMRPEKDSIRLVATDLDIMIETAVEAACAEGDAVALSADKFCAVVSEIDCNPEIEIDEKHIANITAGQSINKIRGLSSEEFPPVKNLDCKGFSMPQSTLANMLKRVSFAQSHDESRGIINGVYFDMRGENTLQLVATDGKRLAAIAEKVEGVTGKAFALPSKAVSHLERLLLGTADVTIRHTDTMAQFDIGSVVLTAKLIEGNFPNWKQVIPTQFKETILIQRAELLKCVSRAKIMTSERSASLKFRFAKHRLVISANTPEVGENQETIELNYKGPEIAMALNPNYLQSALAAMDEGEEVRFRYFDEVSPADLSSKEGYHSVIMPVRLS